MAFVEMTLTFAPGETENSIGDRSNPCRKKILRGYILTRIFIENYFSPFPCRVFIETRNSNMAPSMGGAFDKNFPETYRNLLPARLKPRRIPIATRSDYKHKFIYFAPSSLVNRPDSKRWRSLIFMRIFMQKSLTRE